MGGTSTYRFNLCSAWFLFIGMFSWLLPRMLQNVSIPPLILSVSCNFMRIVFDYDSMNLKLLYQRLQSEHDLVDPIGGFIQNGFATDAINPFHGSVTSPGSGQYHQLFIVS